MLIYSAADSAVSIEISENYLSDDIPLNVLANVGHFELIESSLSAFAATLRAGPQLYRADLG